MEVLCRIHKGSPVIPIQSQTKSNYLHIYPSLQRSILVLSYHVRLGLLPVSLPVKISKAFKPSSILATCPAHLKLLDIITVTILGERYKL